MNMNEIEGEGILPDDYPVFPGYFYVCDEIVKISPIEGTVAQLKIVLACKIVRRCNISKRGLWDEAY